MTTTITDIVHFTPGSTYSCRAFSDYDTVYEFTVVARTARFVTFADRWGDTKRVGVWVSNGVEWAAPHGRYANCAVVRADRT
jgi:hypothetical protein